ncbi:MAG: hypothetical protein AB8G05_23100 [Oligoflexales bacterium]
MRFLILISLLCWSASVFSKTIYYGSERETVSLSYGVSTILRFDEEVKTITQATKFQIEPADAQNPDFRVLTVKPRHQKAKSSVTIILANDVIVNLFFETVRSKLHEITNTFYDFKAKRLRIDPVTKTSPGGEVSEVELMKAMIRGDVVSGYNLRNLSQRVQTGFDEISARLIRVYSGPKFHGYIFKVSNNSKDKVYALDVKILTLGRPNVALLTQADQNLIHPIKGKHETLLRIVAKPTSVYYNINLPVAPIIKNQAK